MLTEHVLMILAIVVSFGLASSSLKTVGFGAFGGRQTEHGDISSRTPYSDIIIH